MSPGEGKQGGTDDDHTWVEELSNHRDAERYMVERLSPPAKKKSWLKRRTTCEKWLTIISLGAIIAIVILAASRSSTTNETGEVLESTNTQTQNYQTNTQTEDKLKDPASETCMSPSCVLSASRVLKAIDMSVDPCENFYDFACGGWVKTHEVPSDRSNLYAYGVLRDDVTRSLRIEETGLKLASLETPKTGVLAIRPKCSIMQDFTLVVTITLLEAEITDEDITSIAAAKNMYQSCLDEELIETRNLSVLYPLLQEFGGWPILGDTPGGMWNDSNFDLTDLLISLLKYNNMPLLPLWVGLDDKNNTIRTIFIDQAWFGMPDRSYYLDDQHVDKRQAYKNLIINVAVYLGAEYEQAVKDTDGIMEFETELANITVKSADRRDNEALYNKMTIMELQDNYTTPYGSSRYQFEWLEYIQRAMAIPDTKVNITEEEDIVLISIPYYQRLFPLMNRYSDRAIANYIVWRIVRNRINNLPIRFRDEMDVYRKVIYGTSTASERWKTCIRYLKSAFDMVLGRMFVEANFNNQSKIEALDMIDNIKETFYETLVEIDWMDADMKEFAREKAEKIVEVVGYPEFLFNDEELDKLFQNLSMNASLYFENVLQILQMDSKSSLGSLRTLNIGNKPKWGASPITVNAFYSFQRNQITFPAGILQPPYFHINQPRSMNYGGIGFLMGHEITHGFDDSGRQYDKDGNLYNWWTQEAETKFVERSHCLVGQYSRFVSPEARLNVDGEITLGENIADNGAVKQAFRAYRNWVEEQGREEPRLPGLNFTHNQLFFLNLAQIRCGISRKDDAINHILTGPHSPNRFRILGSLQNSQDFSEAFQCPKTSFMNPPDKCSVW